ncbi:hypothetical protein ABEF92_005695 [Exophiala dermatitidis]|uniref:Uncharacterized protein n=1 Tax=Exophiala dermatitidis (strain ATCC 34100 / CBS 525.76 / NIH/UT8656) TaxID=858893 RepID=H6BK92_EXODN|nr:uncharacterized protein HMPREF1120_00737 [Exophiala dermatitidis NIH/UT8656]EHY52526.1 hypothetical protein HMPREF1120_00737 [Exophiala dermatitidis NIH/UT8656]
MHTDNHRPKGLAGAEPLHNPSLCRQTFNEKRRITIGGSDRSFDEDLTSCCSSSLDNSAETSLTRASVTVTRSSSRQSDQPFSNGSIEGLHAERKSLAFTTTSDDVAEYLWNASSQAVTSATDSKTVSQPQRPNHYYPPSSWKHSFNVESARVAPQAHGTEEIRGRSAAPGEKPQTGCASRSNPRSSNNASNAYCDPAAVGSTVSVNNVSQPSLTRQSPMREPASSPIMSASSPVPSAVHQSDAFAAQRSSAPSCISQETVLPEPGIAYAHTYYFTTCPHTSPPLPRPLNVQPELVPYHDNLLAYPPYHLRAYQKPDASHTEDVYVIEGPCSLCDLHARREAESLVLEKYAEDVQRLSEQLARLQMDIESTSSFVIHPEPRMMETAPLGSSSSLSPTTPDADLSTGQIFAIVELEDQLDSIIDRRDRGVKSIWRGYSRRWGPGTLGIHHDPSESGDRRRGRGRNKKKYIGSSTNGSVTTKDNYSRSASSHASTYTISFHELEMSTVTLPAAAGVTAVSSEAVSTTVSDCQRQEQSPFLRRASISSSNGHRDRYSDGTRQIDVSSSVDGIKSDGRMVVDWIRPVRADIKCQDRSRSRSRVEVVV